MELHFQHSSTQVSMMYSATCREDDPYRSHMPEQGVVEKDVHELWVQSHIHTGHPRGITEEAFVLPDKPIQLRSERDLAFGHHALSCLRVAVAAVSVKLGAEVEHLADLILFVVG